MVVMDRILGFRYFAPFRDGENKMWKTHPQPLPRGELLAGTHEY